VLAILEVRAVDDALAAGVLEPGLDRLTCVESSISGTLTWRTTRLTISAMSRALSRPA
jgi:hypothetical protein